MRPRSTRGRTLASGDLRTHEPARGARGGSAVDDDAAPAPSEDHEDPNVPTSLRAAVLGRPVTAVLGVRAAEVPAPVAAHRHGRRPLRRGCRCAHPLLQWSDDPHARPAGRPAPHLDAAPGRQAVPANLGVGRRPARTVGRRRVSRRRHRRRSHRTRRYRQPAQRQESSGKAVQHRCTVHGEHAGAEARFVGEHAGQGGQARRNPRPAFGSSGLGGRSLGGSSRL